MLFMGGKGLWAKKLVAEIEPWRKPGMPLLEIGCGACNLTEHWEKPVIAYDLNPALISMWKAGQQGWRPPPREEITEELHKKYKTSPIDPSDPMTAFLLFGCSFRGVWCGGFGHPHSFNDSGKKRYKDPVDSSTRALARKSERVTNGVEFVCASYTDIATSRGQVVYADPPYAGRCTEGIAKKRNALTPEFDHFDFWNHVRQWTSVGAHVFVSEETAPDDFVRYRSWNTKRTLGNWSTNHAGPFKLESLWVHRDSAMAIDSR